MKRFSYTLSLLSGLLLSATVFTGCNKIKKPGDTVAFITVNSSTITNSSGGSYSESSIKAAFSKEENTPTEIHKGGVSVNGEEMKFDVVAYSSTLPVEADNEYNFDIRFGNGETATASVSSPKSLLKEVRMYPEVIDLQNNVKIAWGPFNREETIRLEFKIRSKLDAGWKTVYTGDITDNGEFVVSKDLMSVREMDLRFYSESDAEVTLTKYNNGTYSNNLNANTIITSGTKYIQVAKIRNYDPI